MRPKTRQYIYFYSSIIFYFYFLQDDEYDASTQRGGTQGAGTQFDRQLASLSEEVKQAKV